MRILVSLVMLGMFETAGCGGGNPVANEPDRLSLSLSGSTLLVAQGASGSVPVTLRRVGSTGSVVLSVAGLPSGASATFEQPGTGNSGSIVISAEAALSGVYSLTVEATDGVNHAAASLALTVQLTPRMAGPYRWTSSGPLLSAVADATHPIVSVKDPSVVYFDNQWHVFATTANTAGTWSMVYLHFADWGQAAAARPYYMDATPGYGNHAAPEVFYFRPQHKWYLVSEWGPQYSTTDDITKPGTWTPPRDFFASKPAGIGNWLDYWVICDSANCYFFFTDDAGHFYRSHTSIQNFPQGFDTPVLVMQSTRTYDLFEASNTYRIKGTTQYLTLVEGITPDGRRSFRGFIADRLDGDWTPLPEASSWASPFLGAPNVGFDAGVSAWTVDFSHGELIRDGYDETLTIDPDNLQYLYQGLDVNRRSGDYSQLPWQLALARATRN